MDTVPAEPSVFSKDFQASFYDELFLEWISLYTPKFYFKEDLVTCYFLRDGKPFYTRAKITGRDRPSAVKWCIKNVTHDVYCFPQDSRASVE